MIIFLCAFAIGYGSVVPNLLERLVAVFDTQDPADSIMASRPVPVVTTVLQALAKNEYGTFVGKPNECNTAIGKFDSKFKKNNKDEFRKTILSEEANCSRDSQMGSATAKTMNSR